MRVLVRADGSGAMGVGHVMRCLALAEELRARGEQVTFASASLPERLRGPLLAAGVMLERVDVPAGGADDGRRSAEIAAGMAAHWIVIDGYQFGQNYFAALQPSSRRLLVLDDVGSTPCRSADVILNQNPSASAGMYDDAGENALLLLGPRYALLRRQFKRAQAMRKIPSRADRLLITLGGGANAGTCVQLIERLMRELPSSADVAIVRGPAHDEAFTAFDGNTAGRVRILQSVDDMASLMACAELAIAGGGSTCLELAFMGVPTCIITMADNQRGMARSLEEAGAALSLGPWDDRPDQVRAIVGLAADRGRREEMARRARALVDGQGVERVAGLMQRATLELRPAGARDEEILWEWRNDPEVRGWSFHTDPIAREEHARWFKSMRARTDCTIWVLSDADKKPIGQGRMQTRGKDAEISVSVSSAWRGKGYGRLLIRMLTERYLAKQTGLTSVVALVKTGNDASRRAFEAVGYALDGQVDVAGTQAYRYVCRSVDTLAVE